MYIEIKNISLFMDSRSYWLQFPSKTVIQDTFRKDLLSPLCLNLSISITSTPTLKSLPKVLKIYRQKAPYIELCLHFNREQQQPKQGLVLSYGWRQSSPSQSCTAGVHMDAVHTHKATAKEGYCSLSWAAYINQAFTAARKHRLFGAPEQEWTVYRGQTEIL